MDTLPVSFHSRFPQQAAEARKASSTEWYAATCPFCGQGEDRFRMFAARNGHSERYWCRRCGEKGYVDAARKLSSAEMEQARQRREVERRQREAERVQRVARLNQRDYWQAYHAGLGDFGREAWRRRGIPDRAQDWFCLGLAQLRQRNALVIPFHNLSWDVETVQYRFMDTNGSGKYRFEKGYPAAPFYCEPEPAERPYLVIEGAIKAMVVWWRLCVEADRRYNVVAVPSKNNATALMERLAGEIGERRVYLLLDPDASREERLLAGSFFKNVAYVATPYKVDDMINMGISAAEIDDRYIRRAVLEPL